MPMSAAPRKVRYPSITYLPGQTRADGIKQDMYLIQVPRSNARYRRVALTEDEAVLILAQLIGHLKNAVPGLADQLRKKTR